MTRYLYPGDTGVQAGVSLDFDAYLAPGSPFTVWTDDQGGTDVSAEMRSRDGVTVVELKADETGNYPTLRGPDEAKPRVLWRDTGASIRYPMYPVDALNDKLGEAAATGGGTGTDGGTTTSPGGGNAYLIFGANAARLDPRTGKSLPAGSGVIWITEGTPPVNFAEGQDVWANRPAN